MYEKIPANLDLQGFSVVIPLGFKPKTFRTGI